MAGRAAPLPRSDESGQGRKEANRASAQIAGWAHTQFGKSHAPSPQALMAEVVGPTLKHAGIGTGDVDGVFVGVMKNGFSKQDFQGALVAMANDGLDHVPPVRMENACATGSAALYSALDFIEAGRGRIALVVGAEKMTAHRCDRQAWQVRGRYSRTRCGMRWFKIGLDNRRGPQPRRYAESE